MRESIALLGGEFGRLAIMKNVKGWVTHAHDVSAIVLWLDGNTGDLVIGGKRIRPSINLAVGINALQSHSHEIPADDNPRKLVAIYLQREWLERRFGPVDDTQLFHIPEIAVSDALHDRVVTVIESAQTGGRVEEKEICWIIDELIGSAIDVQGKHSREMIDRRAVDERIKKSLKMMADNVSRRDCLDAIATEVGLSRPHFFSLFKEQMEITPNVYWNMLRINEARSMLQQAEQKMYALAVDLGFTTEGNFSRFFRYHVGVPPVVYREAVCRNLQSETATSIEAGKSADEERIRQIEAEINKLKQEVETMRRHYAK